MVPITIEGVTEPEGEPFTIQVTRVTQDEPLSGSPSAVLRPDGRVGLRAERLGTGNGRVYTIWFTATDSHGLSSQGSVQVGVPHDHSHPASIDDGQRVIALQVP